MLTTLTRTLASRLKPHRTEAIARIRFNACSLVLLLVLTSIVPAIPSLPTALGTTLVQRFGSGKSGEDAEGLWAWLCFAESCVAAICLFNISESIYALKYPRSSPLTPASASRPPLGQKQGTPAKKLFEGVSVSSPSSSPQPQRPFSFSSSLSSSGSPSSTPPYPLSPLSTPSRTLAYSSPLSSSSLNSSFASSTSTVGYTPSPQSRVGLSLGSSTSTGSNLGASYRGRAFGGSTARPLDGSYLGRIVKTEDDDDE